MRQSGLIVASARRLRDALQRRLPLPPSVLPVRLLRPLPFLAGGPPPLPLAARRGVGGGVSSRLRPPVVVRHHLALAGDGAAVPTHLVLPPRLYRLRHLCARTDSGEQRIRGGREGGREQSVQSEKSVDAPCEVMSRYTCPRSSVSLGLSSFTLVILAPPPAAAPVETSGSASCLPTAETRSTTSAT